MVTVAHIVEKILKGRPFLEEAIAYGIVNYTALALMIKKEVEKELGKEVKHSAIMMAIRRLGEKLERGELGRAPIRFEGSDMTIKSDLFETTIMRSSSAEDAITRLYKIVDFGKGGFLTVTQGLYEITIISNRQYMTKFKEALRNERTIKSIDSIASLSIRIPIDAIETVGYFYVITKALGWNDINIVEIVSTLTELTFILDQKDVTRAFSTIEALMKGK